jgi:hypothetical protein
MDSAIQDQIVQGGWCIHQMNQFKEEFDHQTFHYIAQLARKGPRKGDHSARSQEPRCIANNVDMAQYRTRHVQDDCQCSMVSVQYDKIIDIISSGNVPLVTVRLDEISQTPFLHVEPRTAKSRYTAISHIWADEQGNMASIYAAVLWPQSMDSIVS